MVAIGRVFERKTIKYTRMKKLTQISSMAMLTILFLVSANFLQAQKYAYVDTEYILANIPEYNDAQDELDDLSKRWQKEIETNYKQVEELYKSYQAEAVLLPDDIKKKREDEIISKEQEVKELQRKYFGPEGDLFKKRQELIQPIQEKIYNAIESIALTSNFAFVFDKAGGMTMLYGNPKFDISDDVLDEVGSVMQTVKREQRKGAGDK
jgi:outer membrane protein